MQLWVLFQFHLNPVAKGKDKKDKMKNHNHDKSNTSNANTVNTVNNSSNYTFNSSKIKPPRAKGRKVGVYATRSPHRLNNIGLSLAIVESIETIGHKSTKQTIIKLLGLDLVDGTPVYDIKPYIPSDCINTSTNLLFKTPTWVSNENDKLTSVQWTEAAKEFIIKEQQSGSLLPLYPPQTFCVNKDTTCHEDNEVVHAITEIIAQDPRAQYDGREQSGSFEITFCTLRICFKVKTTSSGTCTTLQKQPIDDSKSTCTDIGTHCHDNVHHNQSSQQLLYALIDNVFQDMGDITANEGSYQHNLAIRQMVETDALQVHKQRNSINWLHPVREGQSKEDLLCIKGGMLWDIENKVIVKQKNGNDSIEC